MPEPSPRNAGFFIPRQKSGRFIGCENAAAQLVRGVSLLLS
jgi:hypothetical protein